MTGQEIKDALQYFRDNAKFTTEPRYFYVDGEYYGPAEILHVDKKVSVPDQPSEMPVISNKKVRSYPQRKRA